MTLAAEAIKTFFALSGIVWFLYFDHLLDHLKTAVMIASLHQSPGQPPPWHPWQNLSFSRGRWTISASIEFGMEIQKNCELTLLTLLLGRLPETLAFCVQSEPKMRTHFEMVVETFIQRVVALSVCKSFMLVPEIILSFSFRNTSDKHFSEILIKRYCKSRWYL